MEFVVLHFVDCTSAVFLDNLLCKLASSFERISSLESKVRGTKYQVFRGYILQKLGPEIMQTVVRFLQQVYFWPLPVVKAAQLFALFLAFQQTQEGGLE